jgi:hypothetical protein
MRKTSLLSISIAVFLAGVLFGAAPAWGAYKYSAACVYANKWSSNTTKPRNPAYDTGITNDCCNFVSQCQQDSTGGTKAYDTSGSTEAFQWWTKKTLFIWDSTMSWVNCSYSYNYMMENPAGTYLATWDWNGSTSYPTPPAYPTETRLGDVVYYDWDSSGSKDHVGIRVGMGKDPNSGLSGDFTDQHNSDRYHSIWHLQPYNANYRTTRITLVRPI